MNEFHEAHQWLHFSIILVQLILHLTHVFCYGLLYIGFWRSHTAWHTDMKLLGGCRLLGSVTHDLSFLDRWLFRVLFAMWRIQAFRVHCLKTLHDGQIWSTILWSLLHGEAFHLNVGLLNAVQKANEDMEFLAILLRWPLLQSHAERAYLEQMFCVVEEVLIHFLPRAITKMWIAYSHHF